MPAKYVGKFKRPNSMLMTKGLALEFRSHIYSIMIVISMHNGRIQNQNAESKLDTKGTG
jgi:hypothetical protein